MAGEIGIAPSELMRVTFREFDWIVTGYQKRLEREGNQLMFVWRWAVTHLINISGKSVKRDIKPDELFKFDFEKPERVKITAEQERQILEMFDKKPTKTEEIKTWRQLHN